MHLRFYILIALFLAAAAAVFACGTATGRYDGDDPDDDDDSSAATDDDDDSGGLEGKPIDDFSWTTVEGDTLRLYDYEGKVVLLNVAAWWCAECKEETPVLENGIWNSFKDKDFVLIQLLTEDAQGQPADLNSAQDWKEEFSVSFPLCIDPDWSLKPYFTQASLPFLMLLDKELVVRERVHGFDEDILKAQIEELL